MIKYNKQEIRLFKKLNTPAKIQDFLNTLKHNPATNTCMSPRRVLKNRKAYCLEGAMLAAAILQFHGHKPLLLDIRGDDPDVDHDVALFSVDGFWGAISKTNHAVLRYREPVYKTIRELALSYFHEYFLDNGKKTLRDYSSSISLSRFDNKAWQTTDEELWYIAEYLDTVKHYKIISKKQIKQLRKADPIEIKAGKLLEWKN